MFSKYVVIIAAGLLITHVAASQKKKTVDDGKIEIVFLQLNDVYEISPLDHGRIGGIARIATIIKELKSRNPSTYTVMAGDFLSPSAMGTITYDSVTKKRIAGLQMVEAINKAGIDLVTFGNHEFDIKAPELTDAINSSTFDWVSSNVRYNDSTAVRRFIKTRNGKTTSIPTTKIISFKGKRGSFIRIGILALTLKTLGVGRYEAYEDYYEAAGNAIKQLKGKCDFIIALTHLEIGMDKTLAMKFPEIKLILGGHEHINSYDEHGKAIIAKADANARSAYVHSLQYNSRTKAVSIRSRLLVINNAIAEDPGTREVVNNWNARAHKLLQNQGFEPCEIIDSINYILDGREASVRTLPTNLGSLIAESMSEALEVTADCGIFNSGSIRIDDVLTGYITQYDIFRVLPFGNKIAVKELQGKVIDSLLKTNHARKNDGSYLQYSGITKNDSAFFIKGKSLYRDTTRYRVVMNDYLALGYQQGLKFIGDLKPSAVITPRLSIPENDIRKALIQKLRKKLPGSTKQWLQHSKVVPCY